jgi:hypothetical protein
MVEDLVQIMVAHYGLPEDQVKKFMEELFSDVTVDAVTLETVREKTSDLLLDIVLEKETGA